MSEALLINNISIKSMDESTELSGFIDGDYIYFRVPKEFTLYPLVEWFVAIALLEAMVAGRTIKIDSSLSMSARLYKILPEIQAIYACWNSDLSIVDVEVENLSDEELPFKFVGSFFSAGIDSSHTLIRNLEDITHLIMFRGFDEGNDSDAWESRVHNQGKFATSLGKSLIPVDTNAREWTDGRRLAWEFVHGLFLSAAGGSLGMKKVFVPSSHTYDELFPWGSHPLSDPLWSTESTKILHDGAGFRRGQKTKDLLVHSEVADNLQVCWRNIHINCGECPKCIRSMVAIYLLGGETNSLPPLTDFSLLKKLKAVDESGATFLEDAMILAKDSGDEKVYKILKGYYRKYQISQLWPMIDRNLFGGFIRRLYRKFRRPDWLNWRVTLRGANRWDI